MKKNILTAVLSVVFTLCFSCAAQAQQKPSERSFATEVQKIKAKQAARNTMLQQSTSQTSIARTVSSSMPAVNPAIPAPGRRQVSRP